MAMNNLLILVVLLGVTVTAVQSQTLVSLTVSGYVYCCQEYTDTAPRFANAEVQLKCSGTTVAVATTNSYGLFNIVLGNGISVNGVLITVAALQTCTLNVYTPLSQCNAALTASGYLQSSITLVNLLDGLFAPAGFSFCPY